jgi:uncharacterized protein
MKRWLMLIALLFTLPAHSAGYVLPESDTWDLKSANGDSYRIFVSHPAGKAPDKGYPVLYILDGNTIFASFAEARRLQQLADHEISNTLIVAIGYPITDGPYAHERRMNDFTPAWDDPMPASEKVFASWKTGGNDRFASFILDTLRPEVAKRYPVNPDRQALFGHSLGGLFALHMFYQHPEAFLAIIAASPSIYWNNQSILKEERAFTERLTKAPFHTARLMLVVGDREETKYEMWDAQALAKRLELLSGYGVRSRFEEFEWEEHLGVPTRAVTPSLRFAFSWP